MAEEILTIEEKAEMCRKTFEVPGCYAKKHEGKFYCFMIGVQPECAGSESARFDGAYCSALTNGKPEIVKGEPHYECLIRNKLAEEGFGVNYDVTRITEEDKAKYKSSAVKMGEDTERIEQIIKMINSKQLEQRIRKDAEQFEKIELLAMGDRRN